MGLPVFDGLWGGGGGGVGVVKPVTSHIAPTRRCQAPCIVGLTLPSLTRFKPVRSVRSWVKTDNIQLGYGAIRIWWPMQVAMGVCVVKPVASHIAPARRCQAPYIVGLLLSNLTYFKPVRSARSWG